MRACGLDFGTSNTTLGVVDAGGRPRLVPLEGDAVTMPSAVFYPLRGEPVVGRAAVAAYVAGDLGRLMRSLKSVLGTALIDEATQVGRRRLGFRDVIAAYLATVKARAEAALGAELTHVVHGRPVFFVDGDPAADQKAEDVLAGIARDIGFSGIRFEYEPIAAALDYERQTVAEEIALIADIGGGTSDFSIVRLGPERRGQADRSADILANDGVRIGGTDFDRDLSLGTAMPLLGMGAAMRRGDIGVPLGPFHDLATWSRINRLYDGRTLRLLKAIRDDAAEPGRLDRLVRVVEEERGHTLAIAVEDAKIALADRGAARLDLGFLDAGLALDLDASDLVASTGSLAARIGERVGICLRQAGLAADAIDAVFLTGGSTRLPHVRAGIVAKLPAARVIDGDIFGSVGMGLAIKAGTSEP
jgi:hypothetical chaperone protein